MVALEVIIALALLIIAFALVFKGKITIEINVKHQQHFEQSRSEPAVKLSHPLDKLSEEERKLYDDGQSLLGAINQLLSTGELPKDPKDQKELK